MEDTHYLFGFLCLAVVAVVVISKPNGAPQESCFYMTHRHIHLTRTERCFPPGPWVSTRFQHPLTFTDQTVQYEFKGFMMMATEEGSKDWPTGVFYSDDGTCKRQSCLNRGDTVTHHNTLYKDSVSVDLYGPENMYSEQMQFVATVVVNLTMYYTDIKSSFIRRDPSYVAPAGGENAHIQIAMDPWLVVAAPEQEPESGVLEPEIVEPEGAEKLEIARQKQKTMSPFEQIDMEKNRTNSSDNDPNIKVDTGVTFDGRIDVNSNHESTVTGNS